MNSSVNSEKPDRSHLFERLSHLFERLAYSLVAVVSVLCLLGGAFLQYRDAVTAKGKEHSLQKSMLELKESVDSSLIKNSQARNSKSKGSLDTEPHTTGEQGRAHDEDSDPLDHLRWHVFEVFLTEVGIAGLVALLIIVTIEKFTRSKHEKAADGLIDRIKNDLFYAIFKRHIPPEVFQEVEQCLLQKNIVRRNYRVTYSLNFIPDEVPYKGVIDDDDRDDHLVCSIFTQFELHNIADGENEVPVELFLERPIDEKMQQFVKVEEVKVDDKPLNLIEGNADDDSHIGVRIPILIPQGSHKRVSCRGRTIKRRIDMEVWASRLPSDGISLQVFAPESIEVSAHANHSQKLTHEIHDDGKIHSWELRKGIFPFQSVIFWWKS